MNTTISRSRVLYRGTQLVWFGLTVIETLLAIRFLLKLLAANASALFTGFIYLVSRIFVLPFQTVFPNMKVQGGVLEWNTLLAMLVYWFIALIIVRLFLMGKPVTPMEAKYKLEEQDREL